MKQNVRSTFVGHLMIPMLALAHASGNHLSEPSDLRVWLEMTKSDYKLCENVWIYLFVVNDGPAAVQLPIVEVEDRFALKLSIVHESGRVLRYRGLSDGGQRSFVSGEPGDTVVFPINVTAGFGSEWSWKYPVSLPLGEFAIQAEYLNHYTTDKVTFRVLPLNKEEDALQQARRGRNLEELMNLFQKNETSLIGADLGRFLLVLLVGIKEKEPQRIELAKSLIDLYPDNGCAYQAFCVLILRLPDQELKPWLAQSNVVLKQKYTRYMFRLAANRYNKGYLIKEVEK